MIAQEKDQSATPARCTQPSCLLQDPEVDRAYLAKLIVRVLAGEEPGEIVDDTRRIRGGEVCVDCTLGVLGGTRPFLTDEEQRRLVKLGQWTYRRHRRREGR